MPISTQRVENKSARRNQSDRVRSGVIIAATMQLPKRHLTKHRRARLIAWTLAMLAWLAWVFSADRAPRRRHMRRRYGFLSLDRLARNVALLIIIRATEVGRIRRYSSSDRICTHVRGRDVRLRHLTRSLIGGRLRRALKHGDFTTRVAILTSALRHLDAWAGHHAARRRKGMTRLWPKRAAPSSTPLFTLAAPPAFLADSS
jgi:hypothetical protein